MPARNNLHRVALFLIGTGLATAVLEFPVPIAAAESAGEGEAFSTTQITDNPVPAFNSLKFKTFQEFFPKTLAQTASLSNSAADPAELKNFNVSYALFVQSTGEIGFFGPQSNTRRIMNSNPERDAYLKWFVEHESELLSQGQLHQYSGMSFENILRQTYDVYNLERFTKDHDHKQYVSRATAFLNSPYIHATQDLSHDILTNPIVAWGVGTVATATLMGPGAGFVNNLLGKLTEPFMQWAGTTGAKVWAKPAVFIQKVLNSSTKKAKRNLQLGQDTLGKLDQISHEMKFKGMTSEQALSNWDRVVQYCILMNQVFSETPAQVNNGRSPIFAFSMDAHRNYSTSIVVANTKFELHRKGLDDLLKKIEDRESSASDIHEQEMRLAMLPEGSPEYLAKKAALKKMKIDQAAESGKTKSLIKEIVQERYQFGNVSPRSEEYPVKKSEFEQRSQELARQAGLTPDELQEITYHAGEIRLTQRQAAVSLTEWIYFEFTHPEIRKLAQRNEGGKNFGKEFMHEYQNIQDWLGYTNYIEANKEDLQDLLNQIKFQIDVNVLRPARETLQAAGTETPHARVAAIDSEDMPPLTPEELARFSPATACVKKGLLARIRSRF